MNRQHKDERIEEILKGVQNNTLGIEEAKTLLKDFEDFGFAKLDFARQKRTGFPEVIFWEGKTAIQILEIMERLKKNRQSISYTNQ